ncbi:hypothetical protein PA25_13860 [Pseudoalteromonas sp. A25]|uniref:serine hydrolase domain-containing protein n=1 Tax=Pseudoalteromonas sp. A25 TaxID=116092 RepID=UPI001260F413|nr:serine hydrolase domain-containing protein [Pseudoalteromonas sp. A25]BBN81401.1 hypothetical protein PA25_13860 [Pseudoalteromonas sp. A25]
MINKALVQLLILASSVITTLYSYADDTPTFDKQVQELITQEELTGITWATIEDQQINIGSFGYANVSRSEAMQTTHKMHVGSVAKSVIAMGVLRLITQGELSLETDVEYLLSELSFDNPWKGTSPIMVKHLLAHTAGLDNIRMWQFLSTSPSADTPLSDAFPGEDETLLKVRFKPGTQYVYSNMGYTLLAMVIEKVTGQRYESYLDFELLKPLAMNNSTFEFVSQVGDKADPLLAMGYHEDNVEQSAVAMYLTSAAHKRICPIKLFHSLSSLFSFVIARYYFTKMP